MTFCFGQIYCLSIFHAWYKLYFFMCFIYFMYKKEEGPFFSCRWIMEHKNTPKHASDIWVLCTACLKHSICLIVRNPKINPHVWLPVHWKKIDPCKYRRCSLMTDHGSGYTKWSTKYICFCDTYNQLMLTYLLLCSQSTQQLLLNRK